MVQKFEMLQKQSQQMILSPQMLQAIHMLQMPLMELRELIQQELTTNPVLEENLSAESPLPETTESPAKDHENDLNFKEEFDVLTKLDDEWKDYFTQSGSFRKFTQQDEEKRKFMLDSITTGTSLQDHLLWQWGIFVTDDGMKDIGEIVIGNIDDNGYLCSSAEDLVVSSGKTLEEINEAIKIIQTFNPIGVGARDLKECLLIQLARLGKINTIETRVVENYLDLLGDRKYKQIADSLGVSEKEVQKAAEFIVTLDPKPGLMFSKETSQYVTPDVFLEKIDNDYKITLNDERIPHLHISNLYRMLMHKKDTPKETIDYIREKLKAGNWLIKNIHQRQQTIYRIAEEIVRVQRQFLDEELGSLKPLTMQQVANAINLHESTVSRAIANKYIQTPQGTFQFKYFFSSGIMTSSGESISIKNLKDQIAGIIKEENLEHPLSDQDIIEKLSSQGIKIARRTIAKYRQELGILSSSQRKRI